MEVVAVAERERQWRWEIRHGGQLVRESRAEFTTLQDAIKDGKQQLLSLWIGDDRPQITRKSQCWRRAAGWACVQSPLRQVPVADALGADRAAARAPRGPARIPTAAMRQRRSWIELVGRC